MDDQKTIRAKRAKVVKENNNNEKNNNNNNPSFLLPNDLLFKEYARTSFKKRNFSIFYASFFFIFLSLLVKEKKEIEEQTQYCLCNSNYLRGSNLDTHHVTVNTPKQYID